MKLRIVGLVVVAVLVAVTQVLLSTAGLSLPDWRAVVIIVIEVLLYLWGYLVGVLCGWVVRDRAYQNS